MAEKKPAPKSKSRIQWHHIIYGVDKKQPEWVVPIYQGEHYIISQIQRRKHFSLGFVAALRHMLTQIDYKAEDLTPFAKEYTKK